MTKLQYIIVWNYSKNQALKWSFFLHYRISIFAYCFRSSCALTLNIRILCFKVKGDYILGFLSSTAHQFLRFQKALLTKIEIYGILMAEGKLNTEYMRFNFRAPRMSEFTRWPHLWPSTDLDCAETVWTRAPESTVFGLESIKKQIKVVKKLSFISSGAGDRGFSDGSKI